MQLNVPQSGLQIAKPEGSRRNELEQMKTAKWPGSGRSERVARACKAFRVPPPAWHVSMADVRSIAEDIDLEYE